MIRTALAICDGGVVRLRDLPSEVRDGKLQDERAAEAIAVHEDADAQPHQPASASDRMASEREDLLKAIRDNKGNMSNAAKFLGVSRTTLYRRCRHLGIAVHRTNGVLTSE